MNNLPATVSTLTKVANLTMDRLGRIWAIVCKFHSANFSEC